MQRDSPDDSMKPGISDKRVDMGSMGDFNGVMGKNHGSRHQLYKESALDRSPYYDKVCRNINISVGSHGLIWGGGLEECLSSVVSNSLMKVG